VFENLCFTKTGSGPTQRKEHAAFPFFPHFFGSKFREKFSNSELISGIMRRVAVRIPLLSMILTSAGGLGRLLSSYAELLPPTLRRFSTRLISSVVSFCQTSVSCAPELRYVTNTVAACDTHGPRTVARVSEAWVAQPRGGIDARGSWMRGTADRQHKGQGQGAGGVT
jgi:hypothetical protein